MTMSVSDHRPEHERHEHTKYQQRRVRLSTDLLCVRPVRWTLQHGGNVQEAAALRYRISGTREVV